jgi:hypothetical protein
MESDSSIDKRFEVDLDGFRLGVMAIIFINQILRELIQKPNK